ncbi:methyl-accepting chemotaxis protein [uncultured Desulfuromonas sp.]|uniref:methyl-accepting chemotaxis protein n=1 Tax=uncultured Desulfuromonas sp. TaxID=181013 RepID=UPI002AAA7F70|nr:methyl-accepting chemotaxis protein [uncultured Desulfuromonas sp.]
MRWTVKNKMVAMGALVFIGLLSMATMSYRTNAFSSVSADQLEMRTEQLELLNGFNEQLLILNLAAMDAIVDKAERQVASDVLEEINTAVTFLQGHLRDLSVIADHPDEQPLVQRIQRDISALTLLVAEQLVQAIAAGADDAVFARFDDQIDAGLGSVSTDLSHLIAAVKEEAAVATAALHGRLDSANIVLFSVAAAIVMILAPAGFFFARSIIRPLGQSVSMLAELEAGHLGQRLNVNSRDELGDMARAMDAFADSLQQDVVASLNLLAQGDLRFEVVPRDCDDSLRGSVKKVAEDLQRLLEQIQQTCDQIAAGAGEVADSSQALSQGATESASSLEEISASMNEMASQIKHNAENAGQANTLSTEAHNAAEQGSEQMAQMVVAMADINDSGQSISRIIKVIDEIAFQTNLLALNAAVEAARAGQHGKGFAVVAEEVRNLAARSAKAASETSELIEDSVEKAANGVKIADVTSERLDAILQGVTKVSDLIGEISVASNEQAQGIAQVNQGVGQIDQVTQQNTASAEEGAAASEELSCQVEQLRQMVGSFKLKENTSPKLRAVPAVQTTAASGKRSDREVAVTATAQISEMDRGFGGY